MYHVEIPEIVDMRLCERLVLLQREIWGMDDVDILPAWRLFVTPKIGNILMIGYCSEEPVAFATLVMALDRRTGEEFLYGEMIGVLPSHEGHGLASVMVKKAQQIAKQRGLGSLRWTYEPLRADNANIYIKKMGATVREYHEEYYSDLSGINAGIPVDRFCAELLTDANGGIELIPKTEITITDYLNPSGPIKDLPLEIAIEIPDSIVKVKEKNLQEAIDIRLATRKIFQELFSKGYVIKGFYRKDGRNFYVAVRNER